MPIYMDLPRFISGSGTFEAFLTDQVVPCLIDKWLGHYCCSPAKRDIIETTTSGFSYLFDIALGRLIAAWGISRGRHGEARPVSRMAGHPLSAGPHYHRGHAIPHRLGGPADINLLPQRGSVNIGPFRRLENLAVQSPGSLYFTYWIYHNESSQTPIEMEQGLIRPGEQPLIQHHPN